MKHNQPVTQREIKLQPTSHLVSSTNLKGVITHCNQEFIDISGFNEKELHGAAHNIVRHPDMPPAAFADMWATLKQGNHWIGLVKNRVKNGDHYWVDAYVTPLYDGTNVVGYESVRVHADEDQIARASKAYALMNKGRNPLPPQISANTLWAPICWLTATLITGFTSPWWVALLIAILGIVSISIHRQQQNKLQQTARSVVDDRLMT